ncbi:unnamed protein product [Linum tenue]|uniref:Uncharacterized protein n=1 Tax=Linum tenue TaxID=586396 RepID=A0AAV0I4A6_9ROSI|nr:unnamed protein product [Linum tenue]
MGKELHWVGNQWEETVLSSPFFFFSNFLPRCLSFFNCSQHAEKNKPAQSLYKVNPRVGGLVHAYLGLAFLFCVKFRVTVLVVSWLTSQVSAHTLK